MEVQFSLRVDAEHIAGARAGDMNRCAVADALIARGYRRPSVQNISLSFDREGERWECKLLPPELMSFIRRSDLRLPVEPTLFHFTADNEGAS